MNPLSCQPSKLWDVTFSLGFNPGNSQTENASGNRSFSGIFFKLIILFIKLSKYYSYCLKYQFNHTETAMKIEFTPFPFIQNNISSY